MVAVGSTGAEVVLRCESAYCCGIVSLAVISCWQQQRDLSWTLFVDEVGQAGQVASLWHMEALSPDASAFVECGSVA